MPNTAGHVGMQNSWCVVEHELYHAAQETDAFGAPKFNRSTGRRVFTIRGHELEEFVGVVRRYGADAAGVRGIVDADGRRGANTHDRRDKAEGGDDYQGGTGERSVASEGLTVHGVLSITPAERPLDLWSPRQDG